MKNINYIITNFESFKFQNNVYEYQHYLHIDYFQSNYIQYYILRVNYLTTQSEHLHKYLFSNIQKSYLYTYNLIIIRKYVFIIEFMHFVVLYTELKFSKFAFNYELPDKISIK